VAIKARDYIAKLPDREQKAIKVEAKKLIAEELTLSGIREALRQSQVEVAAKLGVQQPAVSKIERQTDLYLSTLLAPIRKSEPVLIVWREPPEVLSILSFTCRARF